MKPTARACLGPPNTGDRSTRCRSTPAGRAIRLVAVTMSLVLTGCGTGPANPVTSGSASAGAASPGAGTASAPAGELSAGQVALLYMDALRGDTAGLKAYNPDTAMNESAFDGVNTGTLKSLGVTPTEEQNQRLAQAKRTALARVETEVVKESVTGSTATVTLAIRGIDLIGSFRTHAASIDKSKVTEVTKAATYVDVLVRAWNDAPLVEKATSVDLVLTYPPGVTSGGVWVPDAAGAKALIQAFVKVT